MDKAEERRAARDARRMMNVTGDHTKSIRPFDSSIFSQMRPRNEMQCIDCSLQSNVEIRWNLPSVGGVDLINWDTCTLSIRLHDLSSLFTSFHSKISHVGRENS